MGATYILFSGEQYYPVGGAGDKTTVIVASDDSAAIEAAQKVDPSRLSEWCRLDKIEGDHLIAVSEGWVDRGGILTAAVL